MKVKSLKKLLCFVLTLTIMVSSALVISNAYTPDSPTTVSALWAQGETKTFVFNGRPVNLGYSYSYVWNTFRRHFSAISNYYIYHYGKSKMFIFYGELLGFSCCGSFEYVEYSPTLKKVVKSVGVGSSQSEVHSVFGVENITRTIYRNEYYEFDDYTLEVSYGFDGSVNIMTVCKKGYESTLMHFFDKATPVK